MDLKGGPDADTLTPQAAGSESQRGSKTKMVSLERRKVLNTQDVIFVVQLEFTRWSTVTGWAARHFPCTMDHGCRLGEALLARSLGLGLKVKVAIALQLTHLGFVLSSSHNWSLTESGLPRVRWLNVSL